MITRTHGCAEPAAAGRAQHVSLCCCTAVPLYRLPNQVAVQHPGQQYGQQQARKVRHLEDERQQRGRAPHQGRVRERGRQDVGARVDVAAHQPQENDHAQGQRVMVEARRQLDVHEEQHRGHYLGSRHGEQRAGRVHEQRLAAGREAADDVGKDAREEQHLRQRVAQQARGGHVREEGEHEVHDGHAAQERGKHLPRVSHHAQRLLAHGQVPGAAAGVVAGRAAAAVLMVTTVVMVMVAQLPLGHA
eukprot:CAMPEP_0202863468 /NCGR_PEP_ID=MMETSP1391-20130828/4102_1 /ASSEMBLY_ACC=CAM_ASM_000867 /TAXON_ID=1034604 /ORGANISM="Chlamydomonas leiostraca, Strain SAG 11-49" /LENGTH=245 /DNA_ID=CAMNT_0049543113 /DNA_START=1239 /DNA_END=1972 /DNA_ORIENTATION=-